MSIPTKRGRSPSIRFCAIHPTGSSDSIQSIACFSRSVLASSSVYETDPVGEVLDQPDFLNACLRVQTELDPEELLDACKAVEAQLGRDLASGPR